MLSQANPNRDIESANMSAPVIAGICALSTGRGAKPFFLSVKTLHRSIPMRSCPR
jgi:hypothetical protein